jgi:putative ABC transport system permease protein
MALGARRTDVLRMIFRNALSLVLTGVATGFLVSLSLPALFAAVFANFNVHGAWIVAGAPLAVTLIALAACYFPARRASKVDPMVALRYE